MPKRSSKDINETAFAVVQQSTKERPNHKKNPAAVALGRLGGKKGGPARVRDTTSEQRKAWALKAAQARWHKGGS